MRWRALAPGKLNLGLRLGPIRPDGRHWLATVYQSVSLSDELILEPAAGDRDIVVCPGVAGENLAARALGELRRRGWDAPAVQIRIAKRVPVAAGMGGGSGDAAAALRLADAVVPVPPSTLTEIAAGLGADVPAQLAPGISLGTGAGDRIEPLAGLGPHAYVIVPARGSLATPAVFAEADRLELPRPNEELQMWAEQARSAFGARGARASRAARLPIELLVNDLEPAAVSLLPAIGETLDRVRRAGADHALLCGSGPTVAGLFWGEAAGGRAARAATALGAPAVVAEPVDAEFGAPSPM